AARARRDRAARHRALAHVDRRPCGAPHRAHGARPRLRMAAQHRRAALELQERAARLRPVHPRRSARPAIGNLRRPHHIAFRAGTRVLAASPGHSRAVNPQRPLEEEDMAMNRRRFIQAAGAGIGAGALGFPAIVRAQSGPIRLGLLTVKTGPLASGGIDMEKALAMYLAERGNTIAGRKVELIVADTAGVPATARTKMQELVEKDQVHAVIGPLAAFEALAIDDYIRSKQIPTMSVAAAEDLTQRRPNPWFVRATSTSSQSAHAMADYCAKTLGYKRMMVIA